MRMQDYFERALQLGADRTAFVQGNDVMSYGAVDSLSGAIATAMAETGRAMDARAAVFSPNDALAFVAILGIFRSGAVWVPVNARNPVGANAHLLGLTRCRFLFFHSSLAHEVAQMRALTAGVEFAICIDRPLPEAPSLAEFAATARGGLPDIPDDPDRLVSIFPTGGTTGLSKGARWTQRTWETLLCTYWACMPHDAPPVHLVAGPMTHAAGGLALMMMPGGPTNVVMSRPDPLAIMQMIEQHRITDLYLPPTLVYLMLAHPQVRTFDYSSLRYFVVAASPIAPEKLREALSVFGPVMCQCYGQAEAPMLLTFLRSQDLVEAERSTTSPASAAGQGPDRYASCGRATLQTRVAVMDAAGALLPVGSKGEIVVRGGLVFSGYEENPEATAEASAHGWHHTGDIGFCDAEGYVYLVDRIKDMIVTGGFNVFSAEIEQAILAHPAVQECAVVGVPDAKWGEAVKAVVELKPGAQVTGEELMELVRCSLGGVQVPKSVEFRQELPRSANGKVLKRDIRAPYWDGQARWVS